MSQNSKQTENPEIRVPFAQRGNVYDDTDIAAVTSLLKQPVTDNKWQYVRAFEQAWSEKFGAAHSLAVSSCTAALHLALKAIDLQPDDEIITTPWTWVATGNVILLEGAKPVFVDIEADTMNLDCQLVEKSITEKTKAIIAVHFAGNPVAIKPLMEICKRHNIYLIQDAAHAPGATYQGKPIDSFGHLVCHSFYTQKNMSTLGEGGMVTCNDEDLFGRLKLYQNHGVQYLNHYQNPATMTRPWLRECVTPGYNYRLSEASAAVGCTQLQKLDVMNARRTELARQYIARLSKIRGIEVPGETPGAQSVWHFFVIRISAAYPLNRDELLHALRSKGIQTSVHYTPLYHFKPFNTDGSKKAQCLNAEACYEKALSLPLYPDMSDEMVSLVCNQIEEFA